MKNEIKVETIKVLTPVSSIQNESLREVSEYIHKLDTMGKATELEKCLSLAKAKALFSGSETGKRYSKKDKAANLQNLGFETYPEYAEKVFDIRKSQAADLAKVGERFIVETGKCSIFAELFGGHDFSPTQLAIMGRVENNETLLTLTSGEAPVITPDMTCKAISTVVDQYTEDKPRKVKEEAPEDAEEAPEVPEDVGELPQGEEVQDPREVAEFEFRVATSELLRVMGGDKKALRDHFNKLLKEL